MKELVAWRAAIYSSERSELSFFLVSRLVSTPVLRHQDITLTGEADFRAEGVLIILLVVAK